MSAADLIVQIKSDPDALDAVSLRDFEVITAELLAARGFQVNLRHSSIDRAYDLLGVSRDILGFESTWIIQCKHLPQRRRLGIEHVGNLLVFKKIIEANYSLLVTSTFLSRKAEDLVRRNGDLRIADRAMLLKWISEYEVKRSAESYTEHQTFESCFVSYSHHDEDFVQFFVSELKNAGIRVWFAPEDLLPGKKVSEEIAAAIGAFDRLLVVLSENSVRSEWVRTEIRRARKREVLEGRRILFPIALRPFDYFRDWELFDSDLGQDLAVELREYLIPDFSKWQNLAEFQRTFPRVVAGLRAGAA